MSILRECLLTVNSTQRNARESRLLRLSTELRLEIYELAIGTPTWKIDESSDTESYGVINKDTNAFSLTRVCRQTHADTIDLVAKQSTFALHGPLPWLDNWLATTPSMKHKNVTSILLHGYMNWVSYDARSWIRTALCLDSLHNLKHFSAHIYCNVSSSNSVNQFHDRSYERITKRFREFLAQDMADRPHLRVQISLEKVFWFPGPS